MLETAGDLDRLQRLLDATYNSAGEHLRRVVSPECRPTATAVAERLTGMRLLVLATVTADGRPINSPVDAFFYRGRFHFGSAPDSIRFRHIRARPAVSATHLPGEEFAVTVHGDAEFINVQSPEYREFRQLLLDYYVPRYGPGWEDFLDSGPVYARINDRRMYAYLAQAT